MWKSHQNKITNNVDYRKQIAITPSTSAWEVKTTKTCQNRIDRIWIAIGGKKIPTFSKINSQIGLMYAHRPSMIIFSVFMRCREAKGCHSNDGRLILMGRGESRWCKKNFLIRELNLITNERCIFKINRDRQRLLTRLINLSVHRVCFQSHQHHQFHFYFIAQWRQK